MISIAIGKNAYRKTDRHFCIIGALSISYLHAPPPWPSPPRMTLPHLLLPGLRVDVRVNLRGEDAFVPQHLLHNAEVGAVFDEVRREGMPERVR